MRASDNQDTNIQLAPSISHLPTAATNNSCDNISADNKYSGDIKSSNNPIIRYKPLTLKIGQSDYKSTILEDGLLVDKTLFIKEIIDDGALVKIINRPRRWGKSLNLTMLKYYFEHTDVRDEHASLFKDKAIWKAGEHYRNKQGQYPVLYINFKDINTSKTFTEALECIREILADLYGKYKQFLFETIFKLDKDKQKDYQRVIERETNLVQTKLALKRLTEYLQKAYNKNVMVLIDEYDTPMNAGDEYNYYDDIEHFMRGLLSPLLKDNSCLHSAVLIGILRMPKGRFLSDLNNMKVYTILSDNRYCKYFGFLHEEVKELLHDVNLLEHFEQLAEWYGGYQIGEERRVFNPWSVVNFIHEHLSQQMQRFQYHSYWINTSENQLIKDIFARLIQLSKDSLRTLLANKPIIKEIDDHIRYGVKDNNEFSSLLLITGYLTIKQGASTINSSSRTIELIIPNRELFEFFQTVAKRYLSDEKFTFVSKRPDTRISFTPSTLPAVVDSKIGDNLLSDPINFSAPEFIEDSNQNSPPAWSSFEFAINLDAKFKITDGDINTRAKETRSKLVDFALQEKNITSFHKLLMGEIFQAMGLTWIFLSKKQKANKERLWRVAELCGIAKILMDTQPGASRELILQKLLSLIEKSKNNQTELNQYGLNLLPEALQKNLQKIISNYLNADIAIEDHIQKWSEVIDEVSDAILACKEFLNIGDSDRSVSAEEFYQYLKLPEHQEKHSIVWQGYSDTYDKIFSTHQNALLKYCKDLSNCQTYIKDRYLKHSMLLQYKNAFMINIAARLLDAQIVIYQKTPSQSTTFQEVYRTQESGNKVVPVQFNGECFTALKENPEYARGVVSQLTSMGIFKITQNKKSIEVGEEKILSIIKDFLSLKK